MLFWNEGLPSTQRTRVDVMNRDGVVDSHPPIQRTLRVTVAKLRSAGHDVFEFSIRLMVKGYCTHNLVADLPDLC